MTPEDTEPRAAVAIVHASEGEESVLLIRRTEREGDPWSGHWSFPGGRRDDEDAGPLETALRELEEECGIRLGREHLERALEPMNARRRVGKFLLVAPFVFRVGSRLPAVPEPREAVEAVWVPLSILRDPSRHSLRAVPGLPEEMRYPAIGLGEVPLWGFTYRLIAEWLGLGPQHRRDAALAVAQDVLSFLHAGGDEIERGWENRIAVVCGAIPVAAVVAHLAGPWSHMPPVNLVEVQPDYIRIMGLEFEEYIIRATGV